MRIPHESLSAEVLRAVLEEIVTRDGTDYGAVELSTDSKIDRAIALLNSGRTQLLWDADSETASLKDVE